MKIQGDTETRPEGRQKACTVRVKTVVRNEKHETYDFFGKRTETQVGRELQVKYGRVGRSSKRDSERLSVSKDL